ncbi:MAG: hypothetical protein EAZ53_01785 [Bacteroidetes bacterium]|nr:MAG: hypothetical protein EAZ53_01785 [Bacteroidota bacterium]
MGQLARINTATGSKLKSKITSSKPKTAEELEREEFYKKVNDPTNLTEEELFSRVNKHIEELWAK